MNKSDLVEHLAAESLLTVTDAARVVDIFFGTISDGLMAGDHAELRGFGSFRVRDYGGYTGRNPKTGATIQVAPKKMPFFKVGRELKALVDYHDQGKR